VSGNRILYALAVAGAAVSLTACGVAQTVDRTVDPVAAAATKTENAGGSKMTMTMRTTDSTTGRSFVITADGSFDQNQGELDLDLSSALQAANLPAGSDGNVKLLYLEEGGDPVMYMDFPFLSSKLPGGKTWIKIDLEKAGKGLGIDFSQLLGQSNQNPAQTLDLLRASGQIETVGPATIDGVATTDYKGTVDLAKAAQLHGLSQDLVQRLIAAGAPAEIPVEVWIGDDGLVRQMQLTEDLTAGGQSISTAITIDMSDFGTQVSVSAPPSDDVFDLTELASRGAQGLTGTPTVPAPTS
jgi:LppX_LprAFG lipoprotein